MKPIKVGVIASSSVVPKIELELGVAHLKEQGFDVVVHESVYGEHWFYPAADQERADALLQFAFDPSIDVIWCARGGYGATHLLPLLAKASKKKKPKKKVLIGYSDVTALLEFTHVQWGWKTLHAPMVALKTFSDLKVDEWAVLVETVKKFASKKNTEGKTQRKLPAKSASSALYHYPLHFIFKPKGFKSLDAAVVGGNFAVWNAMIGTPYAGNARGKILFLEDLQENVARLNRMIHHLEQSGGLKGVKAIVLGDFLECKDTVPSVFKSVPANLRKPSTEELKPLRASQDSTEALHFIFRSLGERTGIAIFGGAPAGHGEAQSTLALGEKHSLKSLGEVPYLTLAR